MSETNNVSDFRDGNETKVILESGLNDTDLDISDFPRDLTPSAQYEAPEFEYFGSPILRRHTLQGFSLVPNCNVIKTSAPNYVNITELFPQREFRTPKVENDAIPLRCPRRPSKSRKYSRSYSATVVVEEDVPAGPIVPKMNSDHSSTSKMEALVLKLPNKANSDSQVNLQGQLAEDWPILSGNATAKGALPVTAMGVLDDVTSYFNMGQNVSKGQHFDMEVSVSPCNSSSEESSLPSPIFCSANHSYFKSMSQTIESSTEMDLESEEVCCQSLPFLDPPSPLCFSDKEQEEEPLKEFGRKRENEDNKRDQLNSVCIMMISDADRPEKEKFEELKERDKTCSPSPISGIHDCIPYASSSANEQSYEMPISGISPLPLSIDLGQESISSQHLPTATPLPLDQSNPLSQVPLAKQLHSNACAPCQVMLSHGDLVVTSTPIEHQGRFLGNRWQSDLSGVDSDDKSHKFGCRLSRFVLTNEILLEELELPVSQTFDEEMKDSSHCLSTLSNSDKENMDPKTGIDSIERKGVKRNVRELELDPNDALDPFNVLIGEPIASIQLNEIYGESKASALEQCPSTSHPVNISEFKLIRELPLNFSSGFFADVSCLSVEHEASSGDESLFCPISSNNGKGKKDNQP